MGRKSSSNPSLLPPANSGTALLQGRKIYAEEKKCHTPDALRLETRYPGCDIAVNRCQESDGSLHEGKFAPDGLLDVRFEASERMMDSCVK